MLKPVDIGTKNNIDRIKQAIINSLEAAQQNKLEINSIMTKILADSSCITINLQK